MAGQLQEPALTDVYNAWRRRVRRDDVLGRYALPNLRPLCEAFNASLTGDDDGQLATECNAVADGELEADAVIRMITMLAETVADEVGNTSGAVAKSLLSSLGYVCGLLTSRMVESEKIVARRDYLTGLENRLAWDEALDSALDAEVALALVMIDLDGLKQVNDQQGHQAGDNLLKGFASGLLAAIPEGARAYRFGGDEYAVVLFGQDIGRADELMEELARGEEVAAFSYGVARSPDDGRLSSELKQKADAAMYVMKNARKAAQNSAGPALLGAGAEAEEVAAEAPGEAEPAHDAQGAADSSEARAAGSTDVGAVGDEVA